MRITKATAVLLALTLAATNGFSQEDPSDGDDPNCTYGPLIIGNTWYGMMQISAGPPPVNAFCAVTPWSYTKTCSGVTTTVGGSETSCA